MYEAKILKHSISRHDIELVSFEVEYPHAIHKDIMTHRWARNFRSFRATPPEVLFKEIEADPFIPERFNSRVKGMGEGKAHPEQELALAIWMDHVHHSLSVARKMNSLGLAKSQVNFSIQDLCWISGVVTTTLPQLENFFGLRLALDDQGEPVARPEVYRIAELMRSAYAASKPQTVGEGAWHLPLVTDEEISNGYPECDPSDTQNWVRWWEFWRKVSVGRCARVSYLTHDGVRDPEKDIALHDRLLRDGHMSPFEHQGSPIDPMPGAHLPDTEDRMMRENTGCFGYGWTQYRKLIPGEDNYNKLLAGAV